MAGIVVILLGIAVLDAGNNTRQFYSATDLSVWTDYEVVGSTDSTCRISGTIDTSSAAGYLLTFYSIHQCFEIYQDGVLIYQYPVENNNPLSQTPGYAWNLVPLEQGSHEIEMLITSPYSGYASKLPEFLVGTPFATLTYIVDNNLFSVFLCVVIFCIGVCMIVYWCFIRRRIRIEKNLLKLGIFAILLSIWSINESRLFILILHNNLVCSYISFLVILLLPFSFASFIYSFYQSDSRLWELYFTGNLLQMLLCILLQLFHWADLRETLWTTHAMMCILGFIIAYSSYRQLKDGNHSKRVVLNVVCLMLCVITLIMDIFAFYLGSWDSNSFGRIGFLCYVMLLGLASARESAKLMEKGKEATTYQQLAYTDQMTGLMNRAAFNRDFDLYSSTPEDVAVIDFDLNNLKKTNDTYGHISGDKYIIDAARLIDEIFANVGTCYRIGGDEFAVLLQNASAIDLVHYLTMLEWSVDAYNRDEDAKFRMQIAHGLAVYSQEKDATLEATLSRADAAMYSDKKAKKGQW